MPIHWETGAFNYTLPPVALGGPPITGYEEVGISMRSTLTPSHLGGGSGVMAGRLANTMHSLPAGGYVRGHLLNDHLGGPGEYYNLFPITHQANATHSNQVELPVKTALLTMATIAALPAPGPALAAALLPINYNVRIAPVALPPGTANPDCIINCDASYANGDPIVEKAIGSQFGFVNPGTNALLNGLPGGIDVRTGNHLTGLYLAAPGAAALPPVPGSIVGAGGALAAPVGTPIM